MAMRQESGFTLLELMVTVAVAAILFGIAVPNFFTMIQNNRATTQANDLLSSLNVARSEAVKRGTTTTVCISSNQSTCTGTSWAQGWLVWADNNGNGTFDSPGELIKAHEAISGGTTLTSGAVTSITFVSTGMTSLAAGTTVSFSLHTPKCTGTQDRTITLTAVGRGSVARTACP